MHTHIHIITINNNQNVETIQMSNSVRASKQTVVCIHTIEINDFILLFLSGDEGFLTICWRRLHNVNWNPISVLIVLCVLGSPKNVTCFLKISKTQRSCRKKDPAILFNVST